MRAAILVIGMILSTVLPARAESLGWMIGAGYQFTPHLVLEPDQRGGNLYYGHTLRLLDGTGLLMAGLGTGANAWRAEQEASAQAMSNGLGYGESSYEVLAPALGSQTTLDITWAANDAGVVAWLFAARVGLWGFTLEDIGSLSLNIGFRIHIFETFSTTNMPVGVSFGRALPFNTAVSVYGELDPMIDLIQWGLLSQPQFTWIVGGRFSIAPVDWLLLGVETEYQSLPTDELDGKAAPQWSTKAGATLVLRL